MMHSDAIWTMFWTCRENCESKDAKWYILMLSETYDRRIWSMDIIDTCRNQETSKQLKRQLLTNTKHMPTHKHMYTERKQNVHDKNQTHASTWTLVQGEETKRTWQIPNTCQHINTCIRRGNKTHMLNIWNNCLSVNDMYPPMLYICVLHLQ